MAENQNGGATTGAGQVPHESPQSALRRLLEPKTIAVVGARDGSRLADGALATLDSDAEVYLVSNRDSHVFGRSAYPSLISLEQPPDAVFSLVNAERSVLLAEEAADAGAGGLVLIASGFAETGPDGAALQDRLRAAAMRGGYPVVGPNGAGYISVPRRLDLTFLARFGRRPGGVSAVAQSGGLLEAIAAAGARPGGIGLNLLISAGNEAVTDTADFLEYLVEDDATSVILLAVEVIRRPDAFFAAARRAREAGKPVIALKIGRSARSTDLIVSHTGTLAGDAKSYDIAFRQANILLADDVSSMVNQAQVMEQLPRQNWTEVRGLAVLTGSGGMASIGTDLALEHDVPVPQVPHLDEWIATAIPGASVANPLDARGLAPAPLWEEIFRRFAAAPEFDAYLYLGQFAAWDQTSHTVRVEQMLASPLRDGGVLAMSPFAGIAGDWLDEVRSEGVVVGNGALETIEGLAAMRRFMRSRTDSYVASPDTVLRVGKPDVEQSSAAQDRVLPFDVTLELLRASGIQVAPTAFISRNTEIAELPFGPPFAVKLADVAHRADIGAVRLGVGLAELEPAIAELGRLAEAHNLPGRIAVQPMIAGYGEAFIGLIGDTGLGPLVLFGPGGTLVEILRRTAGRMAPFDLAVARQMLDEFADLGIFEGFRGGRPWDLDSLSAVLVSASRLAAGARDWLETLDVNPLIITEAGCVAVDALIVTRQS